MYIYSKITQKCVFFYRYFIGKFFFYFLLLLTCFVVFKLVLYYEYWSEGKFCILVNQNEETLRNAWSGNDYICTTAKGDWKILG